uniref:GRAM domain containing 1B n=1 Tax=Athene cunicularia TaxID=194338 RepID=A0A663LX67_ATHCN
MPAANMTETLQLPALQVPEQPVAEGGRAWSSSSTPTLRRKRFKMRRMKNVQEQSLEASRYQDSPSSSKEYLQLPSIEITPSSDEDTPWSNCSTPSASPRRKRFLLRKWLRVREKKEYSESSVGQFFFHCFATPMQPVCGFMAGSVYYMSLLHATYLRDSLTAGLHVYRTELFLFLIPALIMW